MKRMRKSEFVREFERRCFKGPSGEAYNIDHALDLAEEAGMEWLPEEPELPERVWVMNSDMGGIPPLVAPEEVKRGKDFRRDDYVRIARDAAACYNLVRRLDLNDPDQIPYTVNWLRFALEEEREKLRTP